MKKTIRSTADLQNMALSKGVTVKNASGQLFNSARKVSTRAPRAPAAAIPSQEVTLPPPAPAPIDTGLAEQMREISQGINASNAATQDLIKQMTAKTEPITPVRKWVFEVQRDRRGFIDKIVATDASVN